MGIESTLTGKFALNQPLKPEHQAYLLAFADCGGRAWDLAYLLHPDIPDLVADPLREAAGLPLGPNGNYYVGNISEWMRKRAARPWVYPPEGPPPCACPWEPSPDGMAIIPRGADKNYEFDAWLLYLIDHFLIRWHYVLNGEVRFTVFDYDAPYQGRLVVRDNRIQLIRLNRWRHPSRWHQTK